MLCCDTIRPMHQRKKCRLWLSGRKLEGKNNPEKTNGRGKKQSVNHLQSFCSSPWFITDRSDHTCGKSGSVSTERSLVKPDDVAPLLQNLQTLSENTQKLNVIPRSGGGKRFDCRRAHSADPPLRGAVETLSELIYSYWKGPVWRQSCCCCWSCLTAHWFKVLPSWHPPLNPNIPPCRWASPSSGCRQSPESEVTIADTSWL